MKWSEWKSLFRLDMMVEPPEFSLLAMCPYFFVRILWYTTSEEFRGWPNTLDSGIVLGWRWPFADKFKEKAWLEKRDMALAIYPAMDSVYTLRAAHEIGWTQEQLALPLVEQMEKLAQIAATFRKTRNVPTACNHAYWSADCPHCARRSFAFAVGMVEKYERFSLPNPLESPLDAFRRREAEAKQRLGVGV